MIGFIKDLYIVPDKRRVGLRNQLLQRGEEILLEIGVTAIECNVLVHNETQSIFGNQKQF